MNLSAHYRHLWETAEQRFSQGDFELDNLIDSPLDTRRGITLVARPDQGVRERIQGFLQELAQLEPEQYYYPASDLHLTLLSIISCYPGFALDVIQPEAYVAQVEKALAGVKKFSLEFTGVTASPSTIMVQGFPEGSELRRLRSNVRNAFWSSKLQQSIDQRYAIQTAHCTVVRFRHPLRDPEAFLKKLRNYRPHLFGSFEVQQVELVFNDWYQRQATTQTLATFNLD